jgi:hypothetical protein
VLAVDEGVSGPKLLPDLLPGHDLASTTKQQFQDGEGLAAKPQGCPILGQLLGIGLRLKGSKTEDQRGRFYGQNPLWVGDFNRGIVSLPNPSVADEVYPHVFSVI